jgi:hypothetical protein
MISQEEAHALAGTGGNVLSPAGDKIGGISEIYFDDSTGQPTWVTVRTGLFGTSESFVPLNDASAEGDDIRVSYDKETVKDAPQVEGAGQISPEEEEQLYSYYGIVDSGSAGDRAGSEREPITDAHRGAAEAG